MGRTLVPLAAWLAEAFCRERNALERLIDAAFGRDGTRPEEAAPDTAGTERRNVFDRLFKKKEE